MGLGRDQMIFQGDYGSSDWVKVPSPFGIGGNAIRVREATDISSLKTGLVIPQIPVVDNGKWIFYQAQQGSGVSFSAVSVKDLFFGFGKPFMTGFPELLLSKLGLGVELKFTYHFLSLDRLSLHLKKDSLYSFSIQKLGFNPIQFLKVHPSVLDETSGYKFGCAYDPTLPIINRDTFFDDIIFDPVTPAFPPFSPVSSSLEALDDHSVLIPGISSEHTFSLANIARPGSSGAKSWQVDMAMPLYPWITSNPIVFGTTRHWIGSGSSTDGHLSKVSSSIWFRMSSFNNAFVFFVIRFLDVTNGMGNDIQAGIACDPAGNAYAFIDPGVRTQNFLFTPSPGDWIYLKSEAERISFNPSGTFIRVKVYAGLNSESVMPAVQVDINSSNSGGAGPFGSANIDHLEVNVLPGVSLWLDDVLYEAV